MTRTFDALSRVELESQEHGRTRHQIAFDPLTSIWAVNAGYVAAGFLRAAEQVAKKPYPANISLQLPKAVRAEAATIETSVLSEGSTTELIEGRLFQNGRTAALAHIWTHERSVSPEVRKAAMPPVPHPDELKTHAEVRPGSPIAHPFWSTFDERRINSVDEGRRLHSLPRSLRWIRFHDMDATPSMFVRAGMTIPMIDIPGVSAACNGFGGNVLVDGPAPTIQMTVQFCDLDHMTGWFLSDAWAEFVGNGLLNSRAQIWSLEGALIAQGLTQFVFKAGKGAFVKEGAA